MADITIEIAAASRPFPGETASGDSWAVDWHDGRCRIAIIDGLGHGVAAADAAARAVAALHAHPDLRPDEAIRLCHHALAGSRGAAMAVTLLDPAAGRLTYAGIGNTEAQLWRPHQLERLISYRGIVGSNLRTVRAFSAALPPDWLLIMYTDGISQHMEVRLPLPPDMSLQATADSLLARWARATDDATILIAAPSGAPDGTL